LAQHFADGIEGRVLEESAGARFDPGVGHPRDLLSEALHQARLAEAGLADNQCYLTLAFKRPLPAIHQRAQFVLASDE
jgi:hypothetical protein